MDRTILDLELPYKIERHAAKSGDARKSAINSAELGCFLSHQDIIENSQDKDVILILEDDVIFSRNFSYNLRNILNRISRMDWDIVFLGQLINYDDIRHLKRLINMKKRLAVGESNNFTDFKILGADEIYNWGTFSYLVNPKSRDKIRRLLREVVSNGYQLAIDNTYRFLIRNGRLKAKVVFPHLVGVQPNLGLTIEGRSGVSMDLHTIVANMFMANHDQSAARQEAIRYINDSEMDHDALVASRVVYERLKGR
jgi:GR25 family glycosyltransferase involved in LPS biosynthesis